MDNEAKARLDALLRGYETEQEGTDAQRTQDVNDSKAVRERFVAVRTDVIEPTMREFGEYLKKHSHGYEIVSRETRDVGAGKNDEPSIALTIYPRGSSAKTLAPQNTPTLTFRAGDVPGHLRTQFIKIGPGGVGTATSGRSYALDDVTPEVVRAAILELLESALGRRRS
jgi:hypothetical protein